MPTRKTSAASAEILALCLVQYVVWLSLQKVGHKSTITEDAYCQQLERVIEAIRPKCISFVDRKCYSSAWQYKDAHCKTNGTKKIYILLLLLAHAQSKLDAATTDFLCFNCYKIICSSYGNYEDVKMLKKHPTFLGVQTIQK